MSMKLELTMVPRFSIADREYRTFKQAREGEVRRAASYLADQIGLTGNASHQFVNSLVTRRDSRVAIAALNVLHSAIHMEDPTGPSLVSSLKELGLVNG